MVTRRWAMLGLLASRALVVCSLGDAFEPERVAGEAAVLPETTASTTASMGEPVSEPNATTPDASATPPLSMSGEPPVPTDVNPPEPSTTTSSEAETEPQPTPTCDDGVANQGETGVDCAGPCTARCALDAGCSSDVDCVAGLFCSRADTCAVPTCSDDVRNQDETGVDCGASCGACPGAACTADAACASGACEEQRCCGGRGGDCTRCARRLADGIDCSSNGESATNDCDAFLQCLADNADVCATASSSGCSTQPEDACYHESYGGVRGPGILLAAAILLDARCEL